MKFKLYDTVKVKHNDSYHDAKAKERKADIGTIVFVSSSSIHNYLYLVEIENDVFEFLENELDLYQ